MGFFDNIMARAQKLIKPSDYTLAQFPDDAIIVEAAMRRGIDGSSKSTLLSYERLNRGAQNLKKWKDAVGGATDPEEPRRADLWNLYDNLLLDSHLRSCIDTRISFVQRRPFKLVNDNGDENQDITWLLERPWWEDLVHYVIMSRFQGCTLIELWDLNTKGELKHVNEIPSPFFNARLGVICKEQDNPNAEHWYYKEGAYSNYYVQIGKDNDLGDLERLVHITVNLTT